jgi:hypothetical protein
LQSSARRPTLPLRRSRHLHYNRAIASLHAATRQKKAACNPAGTAI